MKKNVLGQGLSALLGSSDDNTLGTSVYRELYTSQLEPAPYQPRKEFNEDEIFSLAESIQSNGVLQPILVRPGKDNMFEIIAGERRWRAAKKIGLDRVPVLVKDISIQEALTIALVENLQRENLNAIEESNGYITLMTELKITQEELSKIVGKSRSYVANILRLSNLPVDVQAMIKEGMLSVGHAKVLIGLEHPLEAAEIIVQKGMTVRQSERFVQRLKHNEGSESDSEKQKKQKKSYKELSLADGVEYANDELSKIQQFIEERLSYKTNISVKSDGKISIIVQLDSMAQFDDFLGKLNMISV